MSKPDKYIYLNRNSLASEICTDIIQLYENENTDSKYEGLVLSGLNKNIKDTVDFVIPLNNEKWYKYHKLLNNELSINLKKYISNLNNNEEFKNIDQLSNLTYVFFEDTKLLTNVFMVQKYTQNVGKYIYHNDFRIEKAENKYRVITFLWYLNTVEEGGETSFGEDFKIKPEIGKLLLFPASWTYPHAGKMPISSNKYIITGWIYINMN